MKRPKQQPYTSEELRALWPGLVERAATVQKGITGLSRGLRTYIDGMLTIVGGAMRMAEEAEKRRERLEDAERLNKVLSARIRALERRVGEHGGK